MIHWQALKQSECFSSLDRNALERIIDFSSEKLFDAGTTIFKEGSVAEELLVIQEGRIALQMALSTSPEQMPRRVTIDMVSKNEIVGWSAIVEPYIYTLTAVCLQNCKVLSISGAGLRSFMDNNVEVGYKVMKGFINVVASRLDDTRQVLVSERTLVTG